MNLAVIMSVYNAGEYVNDAIQSILNQIYDNYLFYILIDGATDNSYEVCNEYRSNEKIKIFYTDSVDGKQRRREDNDKGWERRRRT